ncbi:tRNA (adenosine(37)-N6)-threonylcarbamoyltransferase complex ATPase subunit type 1 TsaE [Alishewanella longhuensis]|uniref:tRNA (adenosine(37)-N6)-threonylcarbamoyltransferase complex ATPase subunit type 1 TsaE n=1 Tax=Alishewanella longhuensis TaxID=1091037 RepID=UPI00167927BA|nr:tRNA (adenosine(37)-N6)-threonylcarbamoyltransferase complex ATPase subunit type 1 TsaE [Alishewanella longhuensis]
MAEYTIILQSESHTIAFANRLAKLLHGGMVVYLEGALGAGKTTFCRGVIQALGHAGHVKSPTYTLVEPYDLPGLQVYHFDLYRLHDAEELEFMGIRDYFTPSSLCLIEWPERGSGMLPKADFTVALQHIMTERALQITAHSAQAETLLTVLMADE